MQHRVSACIAAGLALGVCASAEAQLLIGTGNRNEPMHLVNLGTIRQTNQYPVPVNIADSQPLMTGFAVTGLAAYEPASTVYFLDFGTSRLYRFSYSDPGSPELVGIVRQRNAASDPISLQGLAIDTTTGAMYGTYNVGGSPGKGIFRLNYENPPIIGGVPAIFVDQVLAFNNLPGGETAWDVRNLDYDPLTNRIYGINDDSDVPRGLYEFDLAGQSATFKVASPTYRRIENDFDGLATGDGKAYFVTDEPGFVYVYDLVNGGQFTDFLTPVQSDSGLFAGAAYAPGMIPEPTTLSIVACALGLGTLRHRRRTHAGC
jgi:hypothetical protein